MTREEALKIIKCEGDAFERLSYSPDQYRTALGMAIKALEHPERNVISIVPCGDAVSREATIRLVELYPDVLGNRCDGLIADIKHLASVLPEQRTGWWNPIGYDGYADGNPVYDYWECSKCGWEHNGDDQTLTAYCPNCGARMEVDGNDDAG